MSYSFWCSSCKASHAGACPSPAALPGPGSANPSSSYSKFVLDRVVKYLTLDELKEHFALVKEELIRRMGP